MFEGLYQGDYWFSIYIIQRGLGLTYLLAFIAALRQFRPLVGENGLLDIKKFLRRVSFKRSPSLFHAYYSDRLFGFVAWLGIILSLVALSGLSDAGPLWLSVSVWFLLWLLYLSIVNVGQVFYGFGWESLLLEAGFYAIFFGPIHYQDSFLIIFLLRWLLFRVEFGAGLIKMRGDSCWRDLTCMNYHHETQPMPNPMSWFFHHLPKPMHKVETFFNHVVQLGIVWLLFAPQPVASCASILIILSQFYLLISGNYSWLNWLTILLAFSGFSDQFLQQFIAFTPPADLSSPFYYHGIVASLAAVVIYMSIKPVKNMISPKQRMNFSFNPLHLVNSYGAFGSVTKKRRELIIEGTAEDQIDLQTEWKPYEFKGKPGSPGRRPPQIAPYHLRLDWQMWFAAMRSVPSNPWFIQFTCKLLQNDPAVLNLLRTNPFEKDPPKYIRVRLYEYRFTTPEERKNTGLWWKRAFLQEYLSPRSLDDMDYFKNRP